MAHYYKPSGRFSPLSFLYLLLFSCTVFPLLAFAYAYAIWYIPFIYISFLFTAGFGFSIGVITNLGVVRLGKVRNVAVAGILAVLASLAALYFHWAVWLDLVISEAGEELGILNLVQRPDVLFELIASVNETGIWGFGDSTISGVLLSIVWVVEFLIVTGVAIFLSFPSATAPFCEETNKWFDEIKIAPFQILGEPQGIVSALESGNDEIFNEIEKVIDAEKESHSKFVVFSSEVGDNYLMIENERATLNDKNELEFKTEEVIEYISISNDLKKKLIELGA